jgi:hypothetical protein
MLAVTAFVVDVGDYYLANRKLQSAADAAALAAASQLPNVSAATSAAQQYGASTGGKNASSYLSGATTTVSTKCISGIPCNPANTVVVTETASVSPIFGGVVGLGPISIFGQVDGCHGRGPVEASSRDAGRRPKRVDEPVVFGRRDEAGLCAKRHVDLPRTDAPLTGQGGARLAAPAHLNVEGLQLEPI